MRKSQKIKKIKSAIHKSLSSSAKGGDDLSVLTKLCLMGTMSTGDESPKELLRAMSDTNIDTIAQKLRTFDGNKINEQIGHLFFIEWCYRNDHLNEDWLWEWETPSEGKIKFSAKRPLYELSELLMATTK